MKKNIIEEKNGLELLRVKLQYDLEFIKKLQNIYQKGPNEFDTSGPLGKSLGRNNSRKNRNGLIVRVFVVQWE